jgi:biotin transporter BioY
MKKKTILKTIGFFIGWLLSFQLIGVGSNLMNQPSNLMFTLGALMTIVTLVVIVCFAWHLGGYTGKLYKEYLESKQIKKEKL